MTFYLGVHRPHWLSKTDVPLFVSHRTLRDRKTLPAGPFGGGREKCPDCGGSGSAPEPKGGGDQ